MGLPTTQEDLHSNEPLVNLEASLVALGGMQTPQPVPVPAEEPKKERKKRTLDPNAPRRPLTAYFLYMQTARPIIAADLGTTAPKKAVQEEGQRRWATMSLSEKHVSYPYQKIYRVERAADAGDSRGTRRTSTT